MYAGHLLEKAKKEQVEKLSKRKGWGCTMM